MTRIQVALGIGGLVFLGSLALYLVYMLIGMPVLYMALGGAIAAAFVWMADWVSEKWIERRLQRTETGSSPGA